MGLLSNFFGGSGDKWEQDNQYRTAMKNTMQEGGDAFARLVDENRLYQDNKDLYAEKGITSNPLFYTGNDGERRSAFNDVAGYYQKALSDLSKERADTWKKNRFNYFGDGMIGDVLNPVAQTVSLPNRIARGENIDVASELGALGKTAGNVAIFGVGMPATLSGKMLLYGGLGGLNRASDTVMKSGSDTDLGELVGNTVGGWAGGMAGGAIMHGLGKVGKAVKKGISRPDTEAYNSAVKSYNAKNQDYQNALNTLKNEGIKPNSQNSLKAWRVANHSDKTPQAVALLPAQATPATVQDAYLLSGNKVPANALPKDVLAATNKTMSKLEPANYMKAINEANRANADKRVLDVVRAFDLVKDGKPTGTAPKLSDFVAKPKSVGEALGNLRTNMAGSKGGTLVSKLLGTKAGKIGAGLGGGLLVANLLGNRGGGASIDTGSAGITDADIEALRSMGLSDADIANLINGGY